MEEYSLISFLERSTQRRKVLESLLNVERKISSQIAKDTGLGRSNTSRAIRELEEKGLVKCLNPGDKMFRYYSITDKGKELLRKLPKHFLNKTQPK